MERNIIGYGANVPCKGCNDRTENGKCHSTCIRYTAYSLTVDGIREKIKQEKIKNLNKYVRDDKEKHEY